MTSLFTTEKTLCNLWAQLLLTISSLNMRMPPEKEEKKRKSRINQPCSIASTNLQNPARSLLAMQLHPTCWVLLRECGQQVAGELMKCHDGGRKIACITYPQGALVVFPKISRRRGECRRTGHTLKANSCAALNSESNCFLSFSTSVEMRAIIDWVAPEVTGMNTFNCGPHFQSFY